MPGDARDAARSSWRTDRPRVLFITLDRVAEQMAGPAIRAWELAHLLSDLADVTLATADLGDISSDRVEIVSFIAHSPRAIHALVAEADVIVTQPQWPVLTTWMHRSKARVVYDLYDPEIFELLEAHAASKPAIRNMWLDLTSDRLHDALHTGHHFMCASEKQRDLWIGAMYGQRLIAPSIYARDPSFRSVIDVVPFGLPSEPPPAADGSAIRRTFPEIGAQDEIVLWNGGIWNWLDPACVVRAFAHLRERRPQARLVFMGSSALPAARTAAASARAAVAAAGLEGMVFFNDAWVPYGERSAWLADADCAVATHLEHLETRYAFRTRLLDCFWSGLPIVCTAGDALAERVQREGLGETVAPADDAGLAAALERVLARGRGAYAEPLARMAAEFAWPRVAEPLVQFVMDARPSQLLSGATRPPWRRELAHQARFAAYHATHHPVHKVNQARVRLLARRAGPSPPAR